MKRVLKVFGTVVVLLFLVSLAYRLSPWSKRTGSLRVELSVEDLKGHRAMLVNDGYLPVFVGKCDTVSDAMQPDTTVGDAIQRWDIQRGVWLTAYQRSECRSGDWGSATFSYELLWPGSRLHTSPWFHWTGDTVIRAGDKVRFLVFTKGSASDSTSMPSQSFVVE
jgi:hypothetical protein